MYARHNFKKRKVGYIRTWMLLAKVIIDIKGCFWHQHGCPSVRQLKRNQFDIEMHKSTVKKRDVSNLELVRSAGYKPLVLWECELQQKQEVIKRIKRRVSLSTLLVS